MDISGIFPPIPTPFNKEEEIDYVKLKENVQKWNEIPFKGMQERGKAARAVFSS
jgi:4-hydroxy-2-oxoglutarate aldolase